MTTTLLESAYRGACYRVYLPRGACDIRIGLACEGLLPDALAPWAILTAFNPQSRVLPLAENNLRHARLLARLVECGWPFFSGENLSDDHDWPAESSVLITGIPLVEASLLGQEFDQAALVYCPAEGGVPELVWLD